MNLKLLGKSCYWRNFSSVVLLVVFIDQLSKVLLRLFLPENVFINENYIFGFNLNINTFFLVFFLFLILTWSYYSKDKLGQALIFSGGASNVIDRIYFGGVVDFNIDKIIAFNLADIAIAAGVLYILFQFYRHELVNKTVK